MEDSTVDARPTVPGAMEYDYTNFYFGSGSDAFALLEPFDVWWREVKPSGHYLYELSLHSVPGTRVRSEEHTSELHSRAYLVCLLLLLHKNTHHLTPHS